ncbi:unnamed protein product [Malus baccata var. baccata]
MFLSNRSHDFISYLPITQNPSLGGFSVLSYLANCHIMSLVTNAYRSYWPVPLQYLMSIYSYAQILFHRKQPVQWGRSSRRRTEQFHKIYQTNSDVLG